MSQNTIRMTDPYWVPGPLFNIGQMSFTNPLENDLGFRHELVVPMPITVGHYYGSNESALNLPKQLVTSGQGEYFVRGGYLRSNEGKPMVNIYNPEFNYERAASTKKL